VYNSVIKTCVTKKDSLVLIAQYSVINFGSFEFV
jgi:hypothetical protein